MKKKKNVIKHVLIVLLLTVTLVVGLVLAFNEPIKRGIVSHMTQKTLEQSLQYTPSDAHNAQGKEQEEWYESATNKKESSNDSASQTSKHSNNKDKQADSHTKAKIQNKEQNKEEDKTNNGGSKEDSQEFKPDYDFEKVKSLDFEEVMKERLKNQNIPLKGKIAIPSIHLLLPIVPGVSNASLSAGAGTLKEEQKMGQGNYALASHNMNDYKTLFSPLLNVKKKKRIYLTNGKKTYIYRITTKHYIAPTDVDVINNHGNKKEVTLITCSLSGRERLLVQGTLIKTENGENHIFSNS